MPTVPPYVLHEAFDGESVVVNMNRGHYFSFGGKSADIWDALVRGSETGDLAARIGVNTSTLDRFMRLLAQEGLIESDITATEHLPPEDWLAGTVLAGSVERFTDIEGLLLIDPIHEFDQNGWPSAQV